MRVLVTGGSGYLGQAVVRALAARGHEPIVFARRASATSRRDALPGRAIDGDIRDRDALIAAARGVDAVCHSAALVSIWRRDPADFDRVNVGGLETVLDVCATLRIPRIACTSSFLALPPAGARRSLEANDYQRSKVRAREIVRARGAAGAPIVSLVPGVLYGPGAATEGNLVGRLIRDHLAGRLPGIVGAARVWSFAFVDDVAAAHVTAIESGTPGEEYILGGENLQQMRLFEILRDLRGTGVPRRIPRHLAVLAAWIEEIAARRRAPRLTRGTVEILEHDWPLDSARSVQKLSYRVRSLDDGLKSALRDVF